MSSVSTYLNFAGNTEEAFLFYKSVFGTEFDGGIMRMSEAPIEEGKTLSESEKNAVMHVQLPILGGHVLMGTDITASMGFDVIKGNNVYINLQPDTKAETERLFKALSAGGTIEMELQEAFWGDYYGSCIDKFGTRWMVNCSEKKK